MTLKEKFKTKVSINTSGEAGRFANQCEQIADDYTIEFAEWLPINEYWWNRKEKKYKKMFINETFYYKTSELLEIFKKEKGL